MEINDTVRITLAKSNYFNFKFKIKKKLVNYIYLLDNNFSYNEKSLSLVTDEFKRGDFVKIVRKSLPTEIDSGIWVDLMNKFVDKTFEVLDTSVNACFLDTWWFPKSVLEFNNETKLLNETELEFNNETKLLNETELDELIIDTTNLIVDPETLTFDTTEEDFEISFPCK